MSPSLSSASRTRLARIVALGTALVALGGCHHRPAALDRAAPAGGVEARCGHDLSEGRGPRFPGVSILRTRSGGFVVQILSGLVEAGQPLYLIDGAPVPVDPVRGIDWLRVEDVAQITVLKDPSQIAVYGPRAASGVVVITTKQGASRRR